MENGKIESKAERKLKEAIFGISNREHVHRHFYMRDNVHNDEDFVRYLNKEIREARKYIAEHPALVSFPEKDDTHNGEYIYSFNARIALNRSVECILMEIALRVDNPERFRNIVRNSDLKLAGDLRNDAEGFIRLTEKRLKALEDVSEKEHLSLSTEAGSIEDVYEAARDCLKVVSSKYDTRYKTLRLFDISNGIIPASCLTNEGWLVSRYMHSGYTREDGEGLQYFFKEIHIGHCMEEFRKASESENGCYDAVREKLIKEGYREEEIEIALNSLENEGLFCEENEG